MSVDEARSSTTAAPEPVSARSGILSSVVPGVFWPSLVVLGVASALAIGFPDGTREVLSSVQSQ